MFRIFVVGFVLVASLQTDATAQRRRLFGGRRDAVASNYCRPGDPNCTVTRNGSITGTAPPSARVGVQVAPAMQPAPTMVQHIPALAPSQPVLINPAPAQPEMSVVVQPKKKELTLEELRTMQQQCREDAYRLDLMVERKEEIESIRMLQDLEVQQHKAEIEELKLEIRLKKMQAKHKASALRNHHKILDLRSKHTQMMGGMEVRKKTSAE